MEKATCLSDMSPKGVSADNMGIITTLPPVPLAIVTDDDRPLRGCVAETLREGALRHLDRAKKGVVLPVNVNLGPSLSGLELAAIARGLPQTQASC